MTYELVFDVADRVPLIALGAAAAVLAVLVILAGLWDVGVLLPAWPLLVGAAVTFVGLEMVVDKSRSQLLFLWPVTLATIMEVARDRVPGVPTNRLPRGGAATMFGTFTLVFAALFGLGTFGAIGLSQQLGAGRAEVLEGALTDFYGGNGAKTECFTVEERRFCYSDFTVTPGFNRMRDFGGPMQPGLQVRVSAIGGQIVRLEIARPSGS
jgi:hypothetical protein